MRKVGLFTIYICNYGAVLQTYALKRCIKEYNKNIDVSVIDFYSYEHYRIFNVSTLNPIKKLIKYGLICFHYLPLLTRNRRERNFISEEFNLSNRYSQVNDLLENVPACDYYLTGSDQVFNSNSKYSPVFFQQFTINKGIKAAYAPSFGQSVFSKAERDRIKNLTKGFDYLSCREKDGAEMLSQVHGKDVPCVIDPTLLLTADQWSSMMKVPDSNDKYLLVYDLNGGVPMLNIARKVAAEKGFKLYCITRHPDISFIYKGFDKVIFDAGPREFVGYFAKASYVITDSFHGTAFSLIFRKNFNTYIAIPKSSQRIESLLSVCHLTHRIIKEGVTYDTSEHCLQQLDEISFNEYRNYSIDYLCKIFR